MKTLKQMEDYILEQYISEQYDGLNKLAGLSEDEVDNLTYKEVEDIVESAALSGSEEITKGVGYKEGYQDALYGVLEYFRNIALAEEAENPENPGRKIFTSVDVANLIEHLVKN